MPSITWYNLIHGPEIWLGIAGLSGIAMLVLIGVAIYFSCNKK